MLIEESGAAAGAGEPLLMEETALPIVRGALVRWTRASGYGVVQAIDAQQIVVLWDAAQNEHPTIFTAKHPPLARIDVANSHACQRQSTGETAVPTKMATSDPPVWRCLLVADHGSPHIVQVPETDLRPVPIHRSRRPFRRWRDRLARAVPAPRGDPLVQNTAFPRRSRLARRDWRRPQAAPGIGRSSRGHQLSASVPVMRRSSASARLLRPGR